MLPASTPPGAAAPPGPRRLPGAVRGIAEIYRAAFSGLPREIWLLCFTSFVNRAGTMVLPFLALFFTRDRGLSVGEAGRLVGAYGLGALGGSFLGGWLSDRIGSIRTQQVSLVGAGIGYFAILGTRGSWSLPLVLLATSVVAEAFRPAVMTATARRAPRGLEARCFALLRLAVNLGMAIGPAVGGFLAVHGYGWLFATDAVTCWLAALLLLLLLPSGRAGAAHDGVRPGEATRSPWADGPFLLMLGLSLLLAGTFFQIFTTFPLYLRRAYGFPENRIGMLLAMNALSIVLFEMVLIHWAERRDRCLVLGVGASLVCSGLAMLPLGSTLGFAVLATLVWTSGEMLSLPLMNALVADRAGGASSGRYMGAYTMSFSAAFVIAPLAGTWVYERFGPERLWLGVGLLALPQLAGWIGLRRIFVARPEPGTAPPVVP
jgi:MFS family permease